MFNFSTLKILMSKNKPEILTGIAVAGTISIAATAIYGTTKANDILLSLDQREVNDMPPMEKFIKIAPSYIPMLVAMGITITCIIGANRASASKIAAYAATLGVAQDTVSKYKEKLVEVLGDKKSAEVESAVSKDIVQSNTQATVGNTIIVTNGNCICVDGLTNRIFQSNSNKIQKAVNTCNQRRLANDWVSLNDFYEFLNLEPTTLGDELGWDQWNEVEVTLSSTMTENDDPAILISFKNSPKSYNLRS